MTIGARLKHVRNQFNLSLEKAAGFFDITAQTLSRYENGKRTPDNDFLEEFGRHFKLSGDWLLYAEPPVFKATELDKDVKESFYELTSLVGSKEIHRADILEKLKLTVPLGKLAEDTPENFLMLFEYMMKDAEVRKAMFHFFHIFQKPASDERMEALEEGK